MSEKLSGKEKYTPTCLEWLVVMLNSTFHLRACEWSPHEQSR